MKKLREMFNQWRGVEVHRASPKDHKPALPHRHRKSRASPLQSVRPRKVLVIDEPYNPTDVHFIKK